MSVEKRGRCATMKIQDQMYVHNVNVVGEEAMVNTIKLLVVVVTVVLCTTEAHSRRQCIGTALVDRLHCADVGDKCLYETSRRR